MLEFSYQEYSKFAHWFLRRNIYNKIESDFPELSAQYRNDELTNMIYFACERARELGAHSVKAYHQYVLLYLSTKGKLECPEVAKFLNLEGYTMDQKLDMLVRQIRHTKV